MAEGSITKKVLAYSLKELMKKRPLNKITVGDICEACEMNRKSFYYHFKDKYDLVNWIFYTDFFEDNRQRGDDMTPGDALVRLCKFFQRNKDFYRVALQETGTNSFYEYLGTMIRPVVSGRLKPYFGRDEHFNFYVDFFVNVYRDALARWVLEGCTIDAQTYVELLYKASAVVGQLTPPGKK